MTDLSKLHEFKNVLMKKYEIKNLAIKFSVNIDETDIFVCFSNTVFVNDKEIRHSFKDYLFKLFDSVIE